jgi:hypothetical protein
LSAIRQSRCHGNKRAQAHPDPAGSLDVMVLFRTQERGTTRSPATVKEATVKSRTRVPPGRFQTGVKINFNI